MNVLAIEYSQIKSSEGMLFKNVGKSVAKSG